MVAGQDMRHLLSEDTRQLILITEKVQHASVYDNLASRHGHCILHFVLYDANSHCMSCHIPTGLLHLVSRDRACHPALPTQLINGLLYMQLIMYYSSNVE